MSILPVILSIVTIVASLVIAATGLVFLLAAGANSTPAQIRELKILCWSLLIVSLLATVAMVWLLVAKRPWWSVFAATSPAIFTIGMLVVLFIRGDRRAPISDAFTTYQRSHTSKEHAMANKGDAHAARTEEDRQVFLKRVESMEEANELKAMEQAIMANDNSLWSCCHIAELYRRRMHRLKAAGDIAGAEDAFAKSYDWMCSFASGATSGGEGAANSRTRDEHLDSLISELGYKPASVTPWNS